ncbi:Predicted nucleotidyltransferase [Halobacillus karajensis]|uniref:nucleotidyltransferase n=1 Tax=Halobacillus karajensis TaxID=195088 RepID=UPI0008A7EDE4|nr:nucleotidyltransferase [Halobacillus karajensis]SEH70935.1 Predicted nucleotidyltransferase [Halobacillus karajensis]
MKSCGVVVEYNPFHNGHLYHLEQSKKHAEADCMIAIMSGNFLQRGEPAIIDKWHRTEAALHGGADLVIELPFLYAVQHSDFFSQGAVQTLAEMGVDSICFGSENGRIESFLEAFDHMNKHQEEFNATVRMYLNEGYAYPEASRLGYEAISFPSGSIDLTQPNNILGYSYVKQLLTYAPEVEPLTVLRKNNHYHDEEMSGQISSATSIRKELLQAEAMTEKSELCLPPQTVKVLQHYQIHQGRWHNWEDYFHLLQYKIMTMEESTLRCFHGVDEGLEYRLKRMIKASATFHEFLSSLKTKRYTWTRLQRTLAHILVGTDKEEARILLRETPPPYARVLGLSETGKRYLRSIKKEADIPIITQPQQFTHDMLDLEARAAAAYYSVLSPKQRVNKLKREYEAPVIL